MKLYPWQQECLDIWVESGTRGILNVITGAGKTVLALAACEKLSELLFPSELQIRIIVPTNALAQQWKRSILAFLPDCPREQIGLYCGSQKSSPSKRFLIYVVNSARYSVSRHILSGMNAGIHQLLICDECHRYTGECNRRIFDFLHHSMFQPTLYHSLGLSATPNCAEYRTVLVPSLGSEIFHYGLEEARADRRIADFVLVHVSCPLNASERFHYAELERKICALAEELFHMFPEIKGMPQDQLFRYLIRFAEEDPEGLAAEYCGLIRKRRSLLMLSSSKNRCAEHLLTLRLPGEKVLVFCERIEQADYIYQKSNDILPGKVGHYHSDMDPVVKQACLDQFRTGEHEILVACRALDEGLDVPSASIAIVVSSSSQIRQRIQRLGRILRPKTGGQTAVLYYLHANRTVEGTAYLPEYESFSKVLIMNYLPKEDQLICREYEAASAQVLQKEHFSEEEEHRFRHYLLKGYGRADFAMQERALTAQILCTEDPEEEGYFRSMLRIHQEAELFEKNLFR